MRICENCKSKLSDYDHLCIYCGEKVNLLNTSTNNGSNDSLRTKVIPLKLNDYKNLYNSVDYKKIIVNGKRIVIKKIFRTSKVITKQPLMVVNIDGVEREVFPGCTGEYILIQGKEGVLYEGPLLVAVVKKISSVKKQAPQATPTPTVKKSTTNIIQSESLPTYQYWLLISSWLFSFTYIAPIIGIIASFIAYSDIDDSNHKDKESQKGLTVFVGLVHAFFIILGIYSNGGF